MSPGFEFLRLPPETLEALQNGASLRTYDLQRFAAEDEGRTEEPTERRKREERDKGNVPKSQDVPAAVIMLGSSITLFFFGGLMLHQILDVFEGRFTSDFSKLESMNLEEARTFLLALFWESGKIILPVFVIAPVLAIVANMSQVGLLFTLKPLAFKPERLKPDFKRILPNRRTMYGLGKVIFQFTIISFCAWLVVMDDFIPMLKASHIGLNKAVALFAYVSLKLLLMASVILLLISVPDYFYQRFEYMENLKMNVSEVRRERREEEGDPLIRQRQRERGMELRRQRDMLGEVARADVVVTNPTHYAVALKYDPDLSNAPAVVAKGTDHIAYLIRTIARENDVPIEENPELARTLHREVEIGQEIPDTLYQVISRVFARLDKFKRSKAAT